MSAATDLRQATSPAFPVQPTRHPQVACSCCNAALEPLQLMGSESQPPITRPRQSLAGFISNVPEPQSRLLPFFSRLAPTTTLDNDSPSAHPLTHPQSASAIRRRTAASRQTTAVALRSMFPASVASAVFLEESVAANAWLWALGRRTACASPARGKHQPAHQLRLVATYCVVWCTCTTLMSWASTSLRRLRTLCRAASAVRSASGNHSRPRNQPAPFLLSAIASSSAAGKETTPN